MTDRELKDDNGDTMLVTEVEGHYLVRGSSLEWRQSLRKAPMRSDDVFICGYPKTGHHWIWEMTKVLLTGKYQHVIERMEDFSLDNPFATPELLEKQTSPRVMTFHGYLHELPSQALQKRCKVIYLQRNVKDVAVSFFNMISDLKTFDYSGDWNGFTGAFLKGNVPFNSWFDHSVKWRQEIADAQDHPVLTMRFEDTKENPAGAIAKLASFLEVEVSEQGIEDIVHLTDFKTMKKFKDSVETIYSMPEVSKSRKNVMFRKGSVGDWRNWMTVSQNEAFDLKLRETGLDRDFRL